MCTFSDMFQKPGSCHNWFQTQEKRSTSLTIEKTWLKSLSVPCQFKFKALLVTTHRRKFFIMQLHLHDFISIVGIPYKFNFVILTYLPLSRTPYNMKYHCFHDRNAHRKKNFAVGVPPWPVLWARVIVVSLSSLMSIIEMFSLSQRKRCVH